MYLSDFIDIGDQRYYVTANVRTGKLKMELVTNEAFERFIRNILSIGEDGELPEGGLRPASEVSA